ncbi:MAG TPA: GMC family oxidoreductase [Polyangiaceae bacterium]|nr:GMC family oxidoreductase [Polyangiaceae bacterium]
MKTSARIPKDPERDEWDAIVVGTGMGGGTFGYELARLGRRVLFLEKGRLLHGNPGAADEPEADLAPELDERIRTGRWPLRLKGQTTFGNVEFYAPLGCSTAGSTGLFGAQLERFRPSDFEPRSRYPEARESTLPEAWPVTYQEMVPFYRRAESLFRVCGTEDPLEPDPESVLRAPPPLSARDEVLWRTFESAGLHPYRSHIGIRYLEGCDECPEQCARECKSDVGTICVAPALVEHEASVLPRCEVLAVNTEGRRATGVRARYQGREITLRARVVALAAGAYMTPGLLIASRTAESPEGLANGSGLVGRNLMLHASDFLTVDPGEDQSGAGPRKALSMTDFYDDGGRKLGALQSVGFPLVAPFIEAYLRYVDQKDPQWWREHTAQLIPHIAGVAAGAFRTASSMATIVEDLPYLENRIVPDASAPNGMRFEYRYTAELGSRCERFRKRIAEVLAPKSRVVDVTWGKNNINYGHVCGTCRFGDDPSASVLDRDNRAHDLDNLYVVDASFFPSSGAINPSLTIAANALRVGALVHARL